MKRTDPKGLKKSTGALKTPISGTLKLNNQLHDLGDPGASAA